MDLEGEDKIVSVALVESGDANANGNGETGSGGVE
jgi:hypothetical protein